MLLSIKNRLISRVNKLTKDGRIYIFLTTSGGYFCSLIFILFLISLSYGNSLAYFCSFLFLSVVWVSCVVTNYNLHGLEVIRLNILEVYFETDPITVELEFKNAGENPRFDIEGSIKDAESEFVSELGSGESALIKLNLRNKGVGVYKIKKADLCTSFPFGIFRSWKPYRFDKEVCVVPSPVFHPLPSDMSKNSGEGSQRSDQFKDEFKSHKKYSNEGMARIDWKVFARRDDILLKEYEGEVSKTFAFREGQLSSFENKLEKLKVLTYWVLEAEKLGASYSLELENASVPSGSGKSHLFTCLRLIAKSGGPK